MIKFGTGGWRAVIADEFTKENIRLLMAGLCRLMEKEGLSGAEICVGYDRRFLSKESALWAAEVLVGYGFHPFVINRSSPTPLMMFTVKKRQEPYGIAVTASHNPAIYNGIKVFTAGGRDADQTVTARIEAEIAKLTPDDVRSVDYDEALEKGLITEANPMNEYLDSILAAVDVDAIKKAALRIGFDPMYGVSWSSLSMLLTTCRCDLEVIHDRHDTLFGGKLPAPNVDTLKPLAALVLDKHCDLGIATDGDADRLFGLGLGADDYLTKPFLMQELLLRVQHILQRVYRTELARGASQQLTLGDRIVQLNDALVQLPDGSALPLTATELALLRKLAENRGHIVTYDALCEAVWGADYYGCENSLNVHIRHLREKLEPLPGRPQFLRTVRGIGYKLAGEVRS